MAAPPVLSLGEKFGLFSAVISLGLYPEGAPVQNHACSNTGLVIYDVFTVVTLPFRSRVGWRSWRHERRNRTTRYLMANLSVHKIP